MDDVNEKLNALLSDPGSMAQIMQLAQQLSGSMGGENTPPSPPSPPQAVPPPAPLPAIDRSIHRRETRRFGGSAKRPVYGAGTHRKRNEGGGQKEWTDR